MASLNILLPAHWQKKTWLTRGLWPLSLVFACLGGLRRWAYRHGWLKSYRLPCPVIVVGNITVGGAGKTPLTLALVEALQARGLKPGVVSRGYGSQISAAGECKEVLATDEPALVGDEPLLMARRAGVPVWIGRDRVHAAQRLLQAHPECNVLICDDGLQHYRLQRDVELVVMDQRGVGNGRLLPAGPLREPVARIARAQAVVVNGAVEQSVVSPVPVFPMRIISDEFVQVGTAQQKQPPSYFQGQDVVAVAGIGYPEKFFDQLRSLGIRPECHGFPDHHVFRLDDFQRLGRAQSVLMTEKDAVKCHALADALAPRSLWALRVKAQVAPALIELIMEKIHGRTSS